MAEDDVSRKCKCHLFPRPNRFCCGFWVRAFHRRRYLRQHHGEQPLCDPCLRLVVRRRPSELTDNTVTVYIIVRCILRPRTAPAMPKEQREAIQKRQLFTLILTGMVPVLVLIMAVLGMIFLGVATPTEASATGAFAAILLAVAYGKFNWPNLKYATYQTLRITSMVMLVVVGASMFTSTFMTLGGGKLIRSFLLGLPFGTLGIILVIMFIIFILGMFIDYFAIILLSAPLFTPIAIELGLDPVWFSALVMMNLQMANLTPPFAYSIFYLRGVAPPEVTMGDIYRGVYPFVALQWIGLLIVLRSPQISLWLPNQMFGA